MEKGRVFLWSGVAFILGIGFASFFAIPLGFLALLLGLGVFLLSLLAFGEKSPASLDIFGFWRSSRFLVAGFLFLAFFLGIFCYQEKTNESKEAGLSKFNNTGEVVVLFGMVDDDPENKEKSQQLKLRIEGFAKEKLLAVAGKYPAYHYGDKLKLKGKIESPESFGDFDYGGYLAKEGIYSTMLFPKIEFLESGQGNLIRATLFSFKDKFRQTWRQFLSPPHLGLFEALVFGEEGNIPADWKVKLNLAGVRHLTAVSGMNITIIAILLSETLLWFGFWRGQANWLSLIIIWLYILMIGLPSSALRAGLMVSLVFLAQGFGRLATGSRTLVFAAVLLLAKNPLLLRYDIGFQLSFLAMAGLIFWQPLFKEKVFKKLPGKLNFILSATFSAQVFTLPLLIFNFGYVSLISPLTNLLLVTLIPYLTIISFIAGGLGILFLPLGKFLALFLWLGMEYILKVVDLSLKIPLAFLRVENAPALLLVAAYLLLVFLTRRVQKKYPWWLE